MIAPLQSISSVGRPFYNFHRLTVSRLTAITSWNSPIAGQCSKPEAGHTEELVCKIAIWDDTDELKW